MHIAVVGGSLAGLAAANVFHRLGLAVSVFEKFPATFEQRGSSLGYVDIPLWEYIRGEKMLRRGRQANRQQGAYFYGDLWKFLYEGLPTDCVHFNHTVSTLGDDILHPEIDGKTYDAVVIADGGWSSLRRYVNGDKRPEYSGYVLYRAKLDSEYFPRYNGEGAHTTGRYFCMSLNVAADDGRDFIMGGLAVGTPESEVVPPEDGASRHTEVTPANAELPSWFMPFVRRQFAHHAGGEVLKWLELCALKGKITPQPLYEFGADKVVAGRILMIGDAAHMASPRTAAGAHTGILDALGLLEAFSRNLGPEKLDAAIRAYEPGGLQRARDLYLRSKEVSRPVAYDPKDDRREL